MNKKCTYFIKLLPLFVFSTLAHSGMSEEQMQQMIQQAEMMQQCMAKIDQSALDELARKGEKTQAEIKSLCDKGNQEDAEKTAIAYSKEIAASEVVKEMKKCGEMAQQLMENMTLPTDNTTDKQRHICDHY